MKWGIIGLGTIAKKFATTVWRMRPEGERIVGVASRDLQKAQNFAATYSALHAYGSYADMMADEEMDAVYIATPNSLHYENAKMALEAGKHVLCEKPFALNATQAAELYALAREKNLFIMEAFWIRFLPVLKEMRKAIAAGEIGSVIHMHSDYGFIPAPGMTERKLTSTLGAGALMDIGIYNLGFAHMVMDSTPLRFSSTVRKNEFGTDEFSVILLEYPQGRSASIATAIGTQMQRTATIIGSEGEITFPDFQVAQEMTIRHNDGTSRTVAMPFDINGFEYEIREVNRCVGLGMNTSDILREQDTLTVLTTMDAIRASWGITFPGEAEA